MDDKFNQALAFVGQPVETEDPTALDQCMDWAFKWCDILGIDRASIRHEYAYQVWKQPNDLTVANFDFIPNTPNGIPQKGDIPVFDQNVPGITSTAGHICVATGEGDTNTFNSLDQNWNGVQHVTKETHGYGGVLGWLRPIAINTPQNDPNLQSELDQCRVDRDHHWNSLNKVMDAIPVTLTPDTENESVTESINAIVELKVKPLVPSSSTLPVVNKQSQEVNANLVPKQNNVDVSTNTSSVNSYGTGILGKFLQWLFEK